MRTFSAFHRTLIAAGFAVALAAVPFAQTFAQDAAGAQSSGSSMQSDKSDNQTVPGKVDDAWITTKVKSEFATSKHIHATDISVDTTDGAVKLSGTVQSKHEKSRAIKLARHVKGVKSVDASGLTVAASESQTKSTTTTTTTSEPATGSTSGG